MFALEWQNIKVGGCGFACKATAFNISQVWCFMLVVHDVWDNDKPPFLRGVLVFLILM